MVFHCCALASTSCRSRRGCQVGRGICALKTQLVPVQICAVLCTHVTEHAWCTFHPGSSLCLIACACRAVCSLPQTRIVLGPCLHACVLPASCRSLLQCLFWSSASVSLPACAPGKMAVPRHGGVTAFPSRAPQPCLTQPCPTALPHSGPPQQSLCPISLCLPLARGSQVTLPIPASERTHLCLRGLFGIPGKL